VALPHDIVLNIGLMRMLVPCIKLKSEQKHNINNNAPLGKLSEDELGDTECLYKACQAAMTDTGVN